MRRKLVAGNWKMNLNLAAGRELATALAKEVDSHTPVDVMVCPAFPYLSSVGEIVRHSGVQLGAQNCYFEAPGAFTGTAKFATIGSAVASAPLSGGRFSGRMQAHRCH